jgi:hypothetical protein
MIKQNDLFFKVEENLTKVRRFFSLLKEKNKKIMKKNICQNEN